MHEAAVIATHPGVAGRHGAALAVGTRVLRTVVCTDGIADTCVEYRLDAVFGGRVAGVAVALYEGIDYLLVSPDGDTLSIGGRPIPAPGGGGLLVAGEWNDVDGGTGLTLVRITGDRAEVIRHIPRTVLAAGEALRWVSPHCVAFTASPATDAGYDVTDRRTWYLVRALPEWRLLTDPPTECRA